LLCFAAKVQSSELGWVESYIAQMADDIVKPMYIFSKDDTIPTYSDQVEQTPLVFEAKDDASLGDEILANKEKFPLADNFELAVVDNRQNSVGGGLRVWFMNGDKSKPITFWDIYDSGTPMPATPTPTTGKLFKEIESGYLLITAADDEFIYVAQSEDEGNASPAYTYYCKIPKEQYGAEWKAFIDWHRAHPAR
jgi:hypothetical protein